MNNTETTSIVKSEKFSTVVEMAQSALLKNQTSVQRATEAGQAILDTIEAEGMSDGLDRECNDILVKMRKTDILMKERRNPVTQIFDIVRKNFTNLESDLKLTAEKIKKERDTFAKQRAEEQKQREFEAQRKLEIEKERAGVSASAEIALSKYFSLYLVDSQNELSKLFNGLSLDNFETMSYTIKGFPAEMSDKIYNGFSHAMPLDFLSKDDFELIIEQVKQTKFNYYNTLFSVKITEYKQDLIDKFPSKKAELEAIAEAEKKDAQEAARLKAEAEEREKDEKDRLEREAKEREEKAEAEAEAKKQESEMESLFNATEETVQSASQAQVRSGYDITITHPAGWVQIFQLFFENEGKNLGIDTLGKKSLNFMKGWCEKQAHKTGEKITSPYVKYEESFKTVARA